VLQKGKHNFAFGLYYAGYGVGWLVGSIVAGLLYENSRMALIAFSIIVQLASVPVFLMAGRRERPD
jgi:predicted MFS family arabinose efflux permease